jgi:ribosomal protein S6
MRTKSAKNIELQEEGTVKLYELGFHILPSVPAGKVDKEVEKIKKILSAHHATIISAGDPELIDLTYEMRKEVSGKYEKCTRAYFGWMKFETTTEGVVDIKHEIDTLESVLRFLIINTVLDGEHTTSKLVVKEEREEKEEKVGIPEVEVSEELAEAIVPSKETEVSVEENNSEIDKAIDELVA